MEDYYEDSRSVNKGVRVDPERVKLLSFRLLTILLASEKLHALCNGEHDSGADILTIEFEKSEIEHLMLQIAVLFRSADTSALEGLLFSERWNPTVGKLEEPTGDQSKDLSLREACNKIIHVKEIKYEVIEGEYSWNRFLESMIYLYGQHNKKNWKATLDIKAFCFEVCHLPD
jgi:hypothetical protein